MPSALTLVRSGLSARADPDKARQMAAYMKTEMPFYGVQKEGRTEVMRELVKRFPPDDHVEYQTLVTALWELPHREEKYLAQGVATRFRRFIVPESRSLYQRFIVEGAWWDLVDETATHLVRELIRGFPDETWPVVDTWIDDPDLWLRRAAIICQIGLKGHTDTDRLFRFCLSRAHETEFFIRKAIGWALREYAKTDPEAVRGFVTANRGRWSGLTYREATKHLAEHH